jgi:hypothetical protein
LLCTRSNHFWEKCLLIPAVFIPWRLPIYTLEWFARLVVCWTYFVVVVCRCVVVSLPPDLRCLSLQVHSTSSSEMITIEITGRPKGISLRFLSAGGKFSLSINFISLWSGGPGRSPVSSWYSLEMRKGGYLSSRKSSSSGCSNPLQKLAVERNRRRWWWPAVGERKRFTCTRRVEWYQSTAEREYKKREKTKESDEATEGLGLPSLTNLSLRRPTSEGP